MMPMEYDMMNPDPMMADMDKDRMYRHHYETYMHHRMMADMYKTMHEHHMMMANYHRQMAMHYMYGHPMPAMPARQYQGDMMQYPEAGM